MKEIVSCSDFLMSSDLEQASNTLYTRVDGFFFEVHPDPSCALSDGSNMYKLEAFKNLINEL